MREYQPNPKFARTLEEDLGRSVRTNDEKEKNNESARRLFFDYITGLRVIQPSHLEPFDILSTRFQTVIFGYLKSKPIATKIKDLAEQTEQHITFIPKFDDQRGYVWIEGYIEKDGTEKMICTRRVYPGVPTFSESSWKGPKVQAMIDWINGRLPLELAGSLKFNISGESQRIALEASMESSIVFILQNNPSLRRAKEIVLIPKQDELYRWVEVHRDDESIEGGFRFANYYRVLPGGRNKLQGSWMGPEEQRYYDYLEGKIDFSHLGEMTIPVQAHAIVSLFTFKGKHLSLQLNDLANFPKGQEVRIIPSMSTNGALIVEVAKVGTDTIAKRFVYDQQTSSFRVVNEQDEVTGKPAGYWTPENTELEVRAFYEQEGSLGFLKKSRNDIYFAARKYPGGIEALERKLGIESPPQVDRDTGVYTDKEGRTWAHAFFLGNELGFHPASANRILREAGSPSMLGRSKSGAEVPLYDAAEARRVLLASGYLERKATPRVTQVSLEETIRNLDPQNPQVIRDKGGRIRWTYPGNSEEQNQALGLNNIQALFLQAIPEFIELFPRNDDGEIDSEFIEAAKSFIINKIGTPEKFKEVMGISPDNLRYVPYFRAGLPDILKRSFVAWGIEFKEEEKVVHLTDVNAKLDVEAVEQRNGIKRLKSFMTGQMPYELVQPFIVNDIPGNSERGYHLTIYTYGGRARRGAATLSPNSAMRQFIIEGKTMVGIPQQDNNKFYQWLEFFEVLEDNIFDTSKSLGSYRIDATNQRIETLGWYGPEIQTFLDYLAQKIDIDPGELPTFKAKLRQVGDGRFYADIGRIDPKNVRATFSSMESREILSPDKEVEFRPRFDPGRGYSWLEGYILDDGAEILIGSKRFFRGETGLYEWKGPEVQAVIDWVNGSLPVEKTAPIRVTLDNKSLFLCLQATQDSKIMVQFAGNKSLRQNDTLQLVPRSDGVYEWIDIYKVDQETGDAETLITRALITRDKKYKLQGGWIGPEKQKERDKSSSSLQDSISPEQADDMIRKLLEEE